MRKSSRLLRLELSPTLTDEHRPNSKYFAVRESSTRVRLVKTDEEYWALAAILGKGCDVPVSAKSEVQNAIQKLAADITIHSDIDSGGDNLKTIEADSKIRAHLLPAGNGLKLELLVRPFADVGSHYPAGNGGKTVIAEVGGQRLQANRNLSEEKKQTENIIRHCPALQRIEDENGQWLLENPEDCLETLLDLEQLGTEKSELSILVHYIR